MKDLITNPAFWIVVAWLGKELLARYYKRDQDLTNAIKELTTEINQLKLAILENKLEVRAVKEATQEMTKMKHDLNLAHHNLKKLDPSLYSP